MTGVPLGLLGLLQLQIVLTNAVNTDHLIRCRRNARCPSKYVLVRCMFSFAVCRYRCPLGQPRRRSERSCDAFCPPGTFVFSSFDKTFQTRIEFCQAHKRTCSNGETVILPGTSWHDTICGKPEHYIAPTNLTNAIESVEFLDTLNGLALAWVGDLTGAQIAKVCASHPRWHRETCVYNVERLIAEWGINAENIFYMLNRKSLFGAANAMFARVVKPFLGINSLKPHVAIVHRQPELCEEGGTCKLQTTLVVPLGTLGSRYVPMTLRWTADCELLNTVATTESSAACVSNSGYSVDKGPDWSKRDYGWGFFSHTLDISLTVKDFKCHLIYPLTVTVTIHDRYLNKTLRLSEVTKIACVWKPKLHPGCNCSRALLDYVNPRGLCSPTCLKSPFSHAIAGVRGKESWILEVASQFSATAATSSGGRVLYGTIPQKSERYCLVTAHVFSLRDDVSHEAPGGPRDLMHCDTVLLELSVSLRRTDSRGYFTVPVRNLSGGAEHRVTELRIPEMANVTLTTMSRQNWGKKLGVKLKFLHSVWTPPGRDVVAAAADWILTSNGNRDRPVRVAVVDVDVTSVQSFDFASLRKLYGSELELMPGISGADLADVIRANRTAYTAFTCEDDTADCRRLIRVHDGNIVLFHRAAGEPIPECHNDTLLVELCTACLARHEVRVFCLNHVSPRHFVNANGAELNFLPSSTYAAASREQSRAAAAALTRLGSLVASHGAFLNLDTLSTFSWAGCKSISPGQWRVGDYVADDPFAVVLPDGHFFPERIGLVLFEELSALSANRDGIVVSLPSASYVLGKCRSEPRLCNRHESLGSHVVRYTMEDLKVIVMDMAKWGVRRYSLGYLDYTLGDASDRPTFTELSKIIEAGDSGFHSLVYKYTRTSGFGEEGRARVDHVVKLEGGMFFQRVPKTGTPARKSFVSVPGVPDLKLGISSDLNIGAPLPEGYFFTPCAVEHAESVPRGAHAVLLNRQGLVAFVDERDRIRVHSPPNAKPQSRALRFPRSESCVGATSVCLDEHRARVWVSFRTQDGSAAASIANGLASWRAQAGGLLSRDETGWLLARDGSKRRVSPDFCLAEKVSACIRASGPCADLADYSDNGWPEGGAGHPLALSAYSDSDGGVLLRIILRVGRDKRRGDAGLGDDRREVSHSERFAAAIVPLVTKTLHAVARLYCSDADESSIAQTSHLPRYLHGTLECMRAWNASLETTAATLTMLESAMDSEEKGSRRTITLVQREAARLEGLCISVLALAVLIAAIAAGSTCLALKDIRRTRQQYRKLQ